MSKFLIFISCAPGIFLSTALMAAAAESGDLRLKANEELRVPARLPKAKTPAKPKTQTTLQSPTNTAPGATTAPAAADKAYLQSALPLDVRQDGRPKWSLEVSVENQRPQGELKIAALEPLNLGAFESNPAAGATLGWWFGDALAPVWGNRVRAALNAQVAWSQHRYELNLAGRTQPLPARLEVIRPQLGLLAESLVAAPANWNTEFWFGGQVARGRLMQSQTSQQSDLINQSLNMDYWEYGAQARAVIKTHYLLSLQYRQRNFAAQEGSTHHGIFAFGLAL